MQNMSIKDLYIRYGQDVYSFLAYYIGHLDVQDLVQETFIKAMKGIRGYNGSGEIKTWLIAIARNVAIDYIRRTGRVKSVQSDEIILNIPDLDGSLEVVVEMRDRRRQLLSAIDRQKESYREVLMLRGIQELSVEETAQVLGWSGAKVRTTYHRALKEIRATLESMKIGGISG